MKKKLFILFILIIPVILTGCSFAFLPKSSLRTPSTKGVFASQDRGLNWQEKNNLFDSNDKINRLNINKLSFGITNYKTLYLATDRGFYISVDEAESWRIIKADIPITDFALNPKTAGLVYFTSGNQLYKTTNNGSVWELIYTEGRPGITIQSIAISQFDTSQIYILTNDGVLMQSSNWGDSWRSLYNFKLQAKKILIDPHNSKRMYMASVHGIHRSEDGGVSWQDLLTKHKQDFPGILDFSELYTTRTAGRLVYLSNYGILTSQDNGESWQAVTLITPSDSVEINTISFNPDNNNELYYIIDNILYHTLDGGKNWQTKVLPASGGIKVKQLLINRENPDILYLGLGQKK